MSDNAKDNAELCDLLLSEYKKVKPKLSEEQKRKKYFSVLFANIPAKYQTYVTIDKDRRFGATCYSHDYPSLKEDNVEFLNNTGITTDSYSVTVLGNTLHYLNVYYGNFKYDKCIG